MKLDSHIADVEANTEALRVFGVILFTRAHAHIIKTLEDNAYWNQLHEISGDRFAIFSCKPAPGTYGFPKSSPGTIGMMIRTWREPNENKELLAAFRITSTENLPLMVVFAKRPDNSILQCSIKLDDATPESAQQRLKVIVKLLAQMAKKIEYESNVEDVHNAFSSQIREFSEREDIIKVVKWIPFVAKIVKMAY